MKRLKKAAALMIAAVLSLSVFQVTAFADGKAPITELVLSFEVHEGDTADPEVTGIPTGVVYDGISFMTADKESITPRYMITGVEYYAVIKVHADADNGYSFYNEGNAPRLNLNVNDNYMNPISGGMPDALQDGYFVSDPAASAPYNNITILKKFAAQGRTKWTYTTQLTVEGEKNIKVGETLIINISEIDEGRDRIKEYTWMVTDETGEERISRQDTGTFSFTPDKPGTYSITVSHLKLKDDATNLEPSEDNHHVEITVTAVPETGDGSGIIFWVILLTLSAGIITVMARSMKKY